MVGTHAMTDLRSRVLAAVSEALVDLDGRKRTPPPPTIFSETNESKPSLAQNFATELQAVSGSAFLVRDRAECVAALTSYLLDRKVHSVAVHSSSLARDIAVQLDGFDVSRAVELENRELERCDCALLEARALLADTGSATVVLDNAQDRLLPYLPRTCAIVAALDSLHATFTPQALACIADAAASGAGGEALIVSGPSRTADIEKVLVLGAHGPEALAVFIVEQP
jgi:L-lactate dehydrogenase complex protein LldG